MRILHTMLFGRHPQVTLARFLHLCALACS